MDRRGLIKMADEAIEYTKHLKFDDEDKDFTSALLCPPEKLDTIECEMADRIKELPPANCSYIINSLDSFEAASQLGNALVMNFANARRPGGGFKNGARAQEESLCRCSTLYASLHSRDAKPMYDYNNENLSACDSDFMVISPATFVFRKHTGEWLEKPFWTSVITVPAPNRNGRAMGVPKAELDSVMKGRLRKMLCAAAYYGYKNLLLGAWGCGAFGNDTRDVSQHFYDLLITEEYGKFFNNIVFAIFNDTNKIEVFEDVFNGILRHVYPAKTENNDKTDLKDQALQAPAESEAPKTYYRAKYEYPACNHTECVDEINAGYAKGVLHTGVPFEAEIFGDASDLWLSVIIPAVFSKQNLSSSDAPDITNFVYEGFEESPFKRADIDYSVLDVGMVDNGKEDELETALAYINYLEKCGIIEIQADCIKADVFYRTDKNGNELVKVLIKLLDDSELICFTGLDVEEFPGNKKPKLRLVNLNSAD